MQAKQFVTVKAASLLTGKSTSTIHRWISQGLVQKFKIEGETCVDVQELMRTESEIWKKKLERMAHARAHK